MKLNPPPRRKMRELGQSWYAFSVCGQRKGSVATRGGLRVAVEQNLSALATADTVIVLPVNRFRTERPPEALLEALIAAHARGCRIVSVCLGTFVIAAAGLLDGRPATTHRRYCAELAKTFPAVEVVPDVLYVDAGDILSSGGVAAGIDL